MKKLLKNKEKRGALLLLLPFFFIMLMFQLLPFLNVIAGSFYTVGGEFTLNNYAVVFRSKFLTQAIKNSVELSLYSTVFGIIIAFQGAYSLNRLKNSSKKIIILLINMISNFNGIPLAFSFVILFGLNEYLQLF